MPHPIKHLYTKKKHLYKLLFFHLMQYDKAVKSYFESHTLLCSGARILDAGCGTGLLIRLLYTMSKEQHLHGNTFHAFDLTPVMIKDLESWINTKSIKQISALTNNVLTLNTLPEHWNSYDLIVSSAMLEHLPIEQQALAIDNLKSKLKPKGKLIVFMTKKTDFTKISIGKLWKTHLQTEQEILDMFSILQFTKITSQSFPSPYSYFNKGMIIIEACK